MPTNYTDPVHHLNQLYLGDQAARRVPTRHQKLFAPLHITWTNTPWHKTSLQHPPTVAPELLKLPKPSPSQGLSEEASPNLKIQSPGRQLPLHEEWKTLPLFDAANMHMGSALWETILKFRSLMWSEFYTDWLTDAQWTWLYIHPWFSLSKLKSYNKGDQPKEEHNSANCIISCCPLHAQRACCAQTCKPDQRNSTISFNFSANTFRELYFQLIHYWGMA